MDIRAKIVNFIEEYHNKHHWAPSVREIGEGVGLSSACSVQQQLKKLVKEGRIIYNGVRQVRVVK